jgi:hypothetical protein
MSQRRNVAMSECRHSMSNRRHLSLPMNLLRVFERLACMLRSRQMFLFSVLLGDAMSVRRAVM